MIEIKEMTFCDFEEIKDILQTDFDEFWTPGVLKSELESDLSEYIIVIDEIHQTFTDLYRAEAIKDLYDITDRCKGRIDITATPNKLDFRIYSSITHSVEEVS